MTQTIESASRAVPAGDEPTVPKWLAGGATAAFVLGIGLFIYWFMGGSFGGSDLLPDPGRPQVSSGRGWRVAPQVVEGVTPRTVTNGKGWQVKTGASLMDITVPANGKPAVYTFKYLPQAILTPEQMHLRQGIVTMAGDPQWQKALAITPNQMGQLRRMSSVDMQTSQPDRDRLIAAWKDYDGAKDKTTLLKNLVATLKEVGDKSLAATKVKASARIGEFKKVFSPQQVDELMKLGAGQKVTAIKPTTPAAK
jgi:hypothetical protein